MPEKRPVAAGFNHPLWAAVVILTSVIKVSLVSWWPTLNRMDQRHDTALFLNQAISILEGRWLGALDHVTLSKGPMTPLWLALNHVLGWPAHLTRELLYLGACLLALKVFFMLSKNRWLSFLLFVFLVFLPSASTYSPFASFFRAALQQPLVLAVQAALMLVLIRFWQQRSVRWGELVIAGGALSAFILNREEWVWLLPQLIGMLVCLFVLAYQTASRPRASGQVAMALLIPGVMVFASVTAVSNLNFRFYGVDSVVEVSQPAYQHAYRNFLRIKPDVSDSARLKPDVVRKLAMLEHGKKIAHIKPLSKGNANAMMLPWAFRSAVNRAGYYEHGAQQALDFYQKLGDEIEAACAAELFPCRKVMFTIVPIFDGYWKQVGEAFLDILDELYDFAGVDHYSPEKTGFADFSYRLNVALLTHSNPGVVGGEISVVNPFFSYWAERKVAILVAINNVYLTLRPLALGVVLAAMVLAGVVTIRKRRFEQETVIIAGLAVGIATQLAMLSLLWASGVSNTARLYFNTYPLVALLIAVSVIVLFRYALAGRRPKADSE